MTYPLLIELRDHHLKEATALHGNEQQMAVMQANWHAEVATQLTTFADALCLAFPSLKTSETAAANAPGDDAINA